MSDLTVKRRRSGAISGAERITGVKNAQADMLLSRKKQHYDVLFKRKEQDIQLEGHKLENETKLLNLENKRNELEYKKRMYPHADHSNDEMIVKNLEKYLVKNANQLCYTDKSLENKIRINCSTDIIPPIVAEARTTIYKKELVKAVEKNRKHMYNFLDKPVSRQNKRAHFNETKDEISRFEEVVRENQVFGYSDHSVPNSTKIQEEVQRVPSNSPQPEPKNQQQYLTLPVVQERPTSIVKVKHKRETPASKIAIRVPVKELERQDLHRRLKLNPVVKEAMDNQVKQKALRDQGKASQNVSTVLSRMVKKKPPTKTQIKEEMESIQNQVGDFCQRIETLIWNIKEEQFKQGIKFVKDKDSAWNRFMETMTKRGRATQEDSDEIEPATPIIQYKRPTTSAIPLTPMSNKERERALMENLLIGKPRQVESAPSGRRGVPHHTAERSHHHSPRAKLLRMLEKNKSILDAVIKAGQDKPETAAGSLATAVHQAQLTAK